MPENTTGSTSSSTSPASRTVLSFARGRAEGHRDLRNLLGGKGANLAEMCRLGLPVPPGFTLSTEVCAAFHAAGGELPAGVEAEVEVALAEVERDLGRSFGDPDNPLLVSVRSGARVSMPGMMDTVLNLGLNDRTVEGLARRSGNERFAWDAYRRFIQMYGDVVLGVSGDGEAERCPFAEALEDLEDTRGVERDTDLTAGDLRQLVATFKGIVLERTGESFPEDPIEQLRGAIAAVFRSWNNERAIAYRRMHGIPDEWGTAVTVMAMVFGNLGESSGTGVAFTRDPASGERRFYGEFLMNAQGEDVVAGIRTPEPIEELEERAPEAWSELLRIQELLEQHYRDMQDLEFTIEDGRLFMLQCRNGKRTGFAAVRIATELVDEGLISPQEALLRVEPESLDQLLQPVFDEAELRTARTEGREVATGLPAGPGAATGRIVFSARAAEEWAARGEEVLLVRIETSPEDIRGMKAAQGILTARGGMTSHAALVARQMGKVCVAGAGSLEIDYSTRCVRIGAAVYGEGEWFSLDGTSGRVFTGRIATAPSQVQAALFGEGEAAEEARRSPAFQGFERLLSWADEARTMKVRVNADQADQCRTAVALGAQGVGLCRTEHMFFGPGKIEPMREMILASTPEAREAALARLLPIQRADFEALFEAMEGRPVTIRTLDPPLHEFLPHEPEAIVAVAEELGVAPEEIRSKVAHLSELNPMLGHRGCRLGIAFPEITRMQARAVFEAACAVASRTGRKPLPELMIPLVSTRAELRLQAEIVRQVAEEVFEEQGTRLIYQLGTMIELPRAALTAADIAHEADFFSFGTNDLTQTTFGISRDDAGKFLPQYAELGILERDPFASLDREGVGRLVAIASSEGRRTRPDLKLGICGEHGGDPDSIEFCQEQGLAYVSCSPYRLPVARLAAAQAALRGQAASEAPLLEESAG